MGTKCELFAKFLSLRVYGPRGSITNLSRFQGTRPDHVGVESSCCCLPSEVISYFSTTVTRSPPMENVFELVGITNVIVIDVFCLYILWVPIQSTDHVMMLRRFDP